MSEQGRPIEELPVRNVAEVNAWLKAHREGWSRSPASYVPRITAKLTAKDGSSWGLNIIGELVVANGGGAQFTQSFSAQQLDPLKRALGVIQ